MGTNDAGELKHLYSCNEWVHWQHWPFCKRQLQLQNHKRKCTVLRWATLNLPVRLNFFAVDTSDFTVQLCVSFAYLCRYQKVCAVSCIVICQLEAHQQSFLSLSSSKLNFSDFIEVTAATSNRCTLTLFWISRLLQQQQQTFTCKLNEKVRTLRKMQIFFNFAFPCV